MISKKQHQCWRQNVISVTIKMSVTYFAVFVTPIRQVLSSWNMKNVTDIKSRTPALSLNSTMLVMKTFRQRRIWYAGDRTIVVDDIYEIFKYEMSPTSSVTNINFTLSMIKYGWSDESDFKNLSEFFFRIFRKKSSNFCDFLEKWEIILCNHLLNHNWPWVTNHKIKFFTCFWLERFFSLFLAWIYFDFWFSRFFSTPVTWLVSRWLNRISILTTLNLVSLRDKCEKYNG